MNGVPCGETQSRKVLRDGALVGNFLVFDNSPVSWMTTINRRAVGSGRAQSTEAMINTAPSPISGPTTATMKMSK